MCAIYRLFTDGERDEIKKIIDEVDKKYGSDAVAEITKGDYYPKSNIPAVVKNKGIVLFKWGYPMYNSSKVVFNAKGETLAEKPMFRNSLKVKRCLIPAAGFYEWDKDKKKLFITPDDGHFFYMVGLYNEFTMADGSKQGHAVLITTSPNEQMAEIHNRMPAILDGGAERLWLDGAQDMLGLIKPYGRALEIKAI